MYGGEIVRVNNDPLQNGLLKNKMQLKDLKVDMGIMVCRRFCP
jgi:hypothetical protein